MAASKIIFMVLSTMWVEEGLFDLVLQCGHLLDLLSLLRILHLNRLPILSDR